MACVVALLPFAFPGAMVALGTAPPPSPPSPPALPHIEFEVTVGGGEYPEEVIWELTCSGVFIDDGGAPYSGTLSAPPGECTLDMHAYHGEGWYGNKWEGAGYTFAIEEASVIYDSYSGSENFILVHLPPSSSPPPSPPSSSPSSHAPSSSPSSPPCVPCRRMLFAASPSLDCCP